MKKLLLNIPFAILLFASSLLSAQEQGSQLYRIYPDDFSRIRQIESLGVNVYDMKPGAWIEVTANPEVIARLKAEGFRIEFIANSFKELYEEQPGLKYSPPFHNYEQTNAELVAIAAAHTGITRLDTIGYSVLGRAICCLKLSDQPGLDEDEPPILIIGAHHGNEVHSVEAVLYQIHHLIDNYNVDPEVTRWINEMEIWFIPLMNPDGREAMRRVNQNGVDLNRNYSFGFTPGGNHGPAAFSEPENAAIRDFAARYPPVMSLSYHTSGQYLLHPWTHTNGAAPDSSAMIYHGNLICQSIPAQSGTGDHYALLQGGRWYFTAGEYCDYMYVTHNTLAFTVEMGISQAPDYSVVPEMVEGNLAGLKTMLRQVWKAGVTGLVTDAGTGLAVRAVIDIPSIDRQGKVPLRTADSLYGRYYRYLEPGTYAFEVSAPGYRTVTAEIVISPDSLIYWDIPMERSAYLQIDAIVVTDGGSPNTSGNADGLVNVGETLGLSMSLLNLHAHNARGVYAVIVTDNPNIVLLGDSLHFGDIGGQAYASSSDTLLFRIHPDTHDGEQLVLNVAIGDSAGFGWYDRVTLEAYAPRVLLTNVFVDDSGGNGNGAIDSGETVLVGLTLFNEGRQELNGLELAISEDDPFFEVPMAVQSADRIRPAEAVTFHFPVTLSDEAPVAYVAGFGARLMSAEGHAPSFNFKLHNILGLYDDFESGENGWTHASYFTTANHHDDWQLGTPAGQGGDPFQAWSGQNCWGTDHGWADYQGTSWDGLYQANVHNYLRSPVIDCSAFSGTGLKFRRLLNLRVNDYGRIKVNDQLVWQSPQLGHLENDWSEQLIDISAFADGKSSVRIIFELQSNSSASLGGWNIDDVVVANGLIASSSSKGTNPQPSGFLLSDPVPNPLSTQTVIRYVIPVEEQVELAVYDLQGRLIRMLDAGWRQAGTHEVIWDGRNLSGWPVESGIYIYRLITKPFSQSGRLLLIR
ncbi:MAG: M14 family zinc carboxypeptidase [Bacteroidales bacterium]